MAINPLAALDRTSATFKADVDTFFATSLPTFSADVNAAAVAMNLNSTNDTSATSNAIGTGAKTFTVSTGKSFLAGMYLVIADTAAPSTNSMHGQVTSYNIATGELVMSIDSVKGSGTKTAWTISQSSPGGAAIGSGADITSKIQPISASVASNDLTVTLNPTYLDFRSSTLTSGTINTWHVSTAINLVIPSGATLGTINAVKNRLIIIAIDNSGTVELAIVNIAGGNNLDETTLISTTAITTGADSANVAYSNSARTNVPFRVVGFVDSTQATAGTWATSPSLVQGQGGNALSAMSSIGYGQVWTDVASSRANNTAYYNTSSKPMQISVTCQFGASGGLSLFIDNNLVATCTGPNTYLSQLSAIVPPNSTYKFLEVGASIMYYFWELK
jgi:hypothetical protein